MPMKKTSANPSINPSVGQPPRESDNLCKRLADEYPEQFAEWLFGVRQVKVEKTELDREPVRADAVIFSHAGEEMLHAEFQTTMKSDVPVPLRMLDYYVGPKRKNANQRVRQVLIVLKPTGEQIPDRYEDERTVHQYDVVLMWEQNPEDLLKYEGLLPLATLCRAKSPEKLLAAVAEQINRIQSRDQRREAMAQSRVLAGLRYDGTLIYQTLKESTMFEESTVYQDIFQKGERRGVQLGVQQGESRVVLRMLERRVGKLSLKLYQRIEDLAIEQLEVLCDALLDFQTKADLNAWLKQHAAARNGVARNGQDS